MVEITKKGEVFRRENLQEYRQIWIELQFDIMGK
ncbi:MAG: hypothetical protein CM1200mP10_28180 [Candidatus Neomarinimicrobiota bacterium]|nr:MAG: hypothetical protein CM1200mP10_28180 [Candidatus Neomarinimicrobiota bacterium]